MSISNEKNSSTRPNLDELISLREAADLSELSPSHLRLLVSQGNIWGMKIVRNWVPIE